LLINYSFQKKLIDYNFVIVDFNDLIIQEICMERSVASKQILKVNLHISTVTYARNEECSLGDMS